MYLIFKNNEFLFGMLVNDVLRVVDKQSVKYSDGKFLIDDMEIKEIELTKVTKLKHSCDIDKRKLIIVDNDGIGKFAIAVQDVLGFIKENVQILKKQDFLNKYGYEHVRGFIIKDNMLVTIIGKEFLNYRI